MISSKLNGGVGNQLFQIAAAYALAKRNNDTCAFDFSPIPKNQGRGPMCYADTVYKNIQHLKGKSFNSKLYIENGIEYKPIPYSPNLLLSGYFQSEKYFSDYSEEIRELFSDHYLINGLRDQFEAKLTNSVSVHVRRGDYLRFPNVYPIHCKAYYDKALSVIESFATIDNILVFSDDISWCKKMFTDDRVHFMTGLEDYCDLYLMSLCDHHVIANSTFSWWGAWLGETDDTITVAPEKWFIKAGLDYNDIVPNRWIKI